MRSRLFHAVIAGGFALATPLAACSSKNSDTPLTEATDASGDDADAYQPTPDADPPDADAGDAAEDAMDMDGGYDADSGWPPTK